MRALTAGYSFFVEDAGELYKVFANGLEKVTVEFCRPSRPGDRWIHQKTRLCLSENMHEENRQATLTAYNRFRELAFIESPYPAL